MNKKLISAFIAFTLLTPTAAQAALKNQTDSTPSIAVLDTAINSSLPVFKGKIIQEVCSLDFSSCPNGLAFMEGPGAANMDPKIINLNGFDHGTQMASVVIKQNPNVNIVFIRIIAHNTSVGTTAYGLRKPTYESTVYNALNWVKSNALKYNIKAVAMAQSQRPVGAVGTDYCNKTPITQKSIQDLNSMSIPVFVSAGNDSDYNRINWPACLPETISIGWVDDINEISSKSNNDSKLLDFFEKGSFIKAIGPDNVERFVSGTSPATQIASAKWVALSQSKPNLSYTDLYNLLLKTAKITKGRQGQFTKLINLEGALNG